MYQLACTLPEHAEWLIEQGRADEADPLAAERARSSGGKSHGLGSSGRHASGNGSGSSGS